ncbi:uncharacterized protein DEA37_0014819 [Paragonimus westermani]|uniref:Reverse transcriptase domain-containing protein n=1 Tax=Paragonimus westermani TaxID=34504 RepID=A0A5J4NNP8_9TREM|nr:uncharacterized protein DEA37_0014819 [Paragonimus westermani]
MFNMPYHKLVHWLIWLLEPLRRKTAERSLEVTFSFVDYLRDLKLNDKVLSSVDVKSLFTNVPPT